MYGMHPRGVYELRNLGKIESKSVDGEDFVVGIHELLENVKKKLQESIGKYKQRANLKMKEVNFKVGDLVMAYL